jgi:hypothetical protein
MYLQSAMVVDETKHPKFIQENIDATARRPHQFRQRFLRYLANDCFMLGLLFHNVPARDEHVPIVSQWN